MESRTDSSLHQVSRGHYFLKELTLNLSSTFHQIHKERHQSKNFLKGEVIDQRFAVLKLLGRGTFGKVLKARNLNTGEYVAIKIIENSSKFQRHALKEINTLTDIEEYEPNNEYVVKMLEHFQWRDYTCLVFELLHKTLYHLLKDTHFRGLSLSNVKVFAWQILMALKFLSVPELNLVHCDLKPENIMIISHSKAGLKLIDFGSACKKSYKYRYVQSLYYRAPEVLTEVNYNSSLDIWSAGCIFCELLTGKPLFPGKNDQDQLVMFI
jgi:dual specificity tyrosine-phosphorylation-regulated kinase 1